jgi:hypothetical protein
MKTARHRGLHLLKIVLSNRRCSAHQPNPNYRIGRKWVSLWVLSRMAIHFPIGNISQVLAIK